MPLVFGVNNFPNGLRLVWQKLCGFLHTLIYMGVSKNRGKHPKMDGENNGKPY